MVVYNSDRIIINQHISSYTKKHQTRIELMIKKNMLYAMIVTIITTLSGCATEANFNNTSNQQPNSYKLVQINNQTISANNRYQLVSDSISLRRISKSLTRPYIYNIRHGDALSVVVWGYPKLNNPQGTTYQSNPVIYDVENNGDIYYPYVGAIHINGKTITDARKTIYNALKKHIKDPQINVQIVGYNNAHASIYGEVKDAERIPLKSVPITLMDAIDLSGGTTTDADVHHISIKRGNKNYPVNLSSKPANKPIILQNGDIIYIPNVRQYRVFVLGAVHNPTSIWMNKQNFSIADALAEAYGINNTRSNQNIYVLRSYPHGKMVAYYMNLSHKTTLFYAQQFHLRNNDIVYVGTRLLSHWNDMISQLLPTTQIPYYLSRTTREIQLISK